MGPSVEEAEQRPCVLGGKGVGLDHEVGLEVGEGEHSPFGDVERLEEEACGGSELGLELGDLKTMVINGEGKEKAPFSGSGGTAPT